MRPALIAGTAFAMTAILVLVVLFIGGTAEVPEPAVGEERGVESPAAGGDRPSPASRPAEPDRGATGATGGAAEERGAEAPPAIDGRPPVAGGASSGRSGLPGPPPPRAGHRGTAPPVEAPPEMREALGEERREIVAALVEEMTPELRRCTAQSSAPETFLRSAMLQVRVEERPEGFAPRVHAVLGAQVEDAVHRCWHEVLSASPFPPPHEVLDRMEDGWRQYEVWIGAQLVDEEATEPPGD